MAQVQVKVKGTREFQRGSKTLAGNINAQAEKQFASVAAQTATLVRSTVPRQSGKMQSSLFGRPWAGSHAGKGAYVGYNDLVYAGPVDYGGWPKGRRFIREGRYLWPIAEEIGHGRLQNAGETAAKQEIASMRWPKPTEL